MISPTTLLVDAHATPCLPTSGLWHPLAQIPPSGVIHHARDVVGVLIFTGMVIGTWLWAAGLHRTREDRRTALEWERETGTCVLGYDAWFREGISPGDRITLAEFDRLAAGSATIRRGDRHAMEAHCDE